MEIREATPEDAETVREVHADSIRGLGTEAYSEEQVDAWAAGCESADYAMAIESVEDRFVVAEGGEGIHGFGTLSFDTPAFISNRSESRP
ncbi:GNAT family N-acetyltransferase [Halalkalicoccus ordinarius]|uniref:GNAT family N-acetyltransferase n=1 Tax=Halalkalicoccus ordinarius TaxID=3116651 RepID=UPI00300ECBF0